MSCSGQLKKVTQNSHFSCPAETDPYMHMIHIFATSHSGYRVNQILYDKDKDQDDDDDGGGDIEGAQSVDIVRCCRGDDWQVIEPVLVSAPAGHQISNGQKLHRCKGRSTKYQMDKISQFSNPSGQLDLRNIESKFI